MADIDDLECDIAVIGAGTAGLAAARTAQRDGARVLLIDDKFAGTVCATVGCMPSKLLIAAARSAHAVRKAPLFGVEPHGVEIDGRAVMERVRAERDTFAAATRKSFEDFPEGTCIKARAHFTGPTTLALDDGRTLSAKAIVIATGATPQVPKPFEGLGDLALTNQTVFEVADVPKSLAVIGGGAIGLELAQAFARLGARTTVFDHEQSIGGIADEDAQGELQSILETELDLCLGVKVQAERRGEEAILSWSGRDTGQASFDRVLVAAGRPPQLADLDLQAAGLACDSRGVPLFDPETMQCGDAPIFIAGDADARVPVLHEASLDGRIAGGNAARYPNVRRSTRPPRFQITFCEPPVAIIGDPPHEDTVVGEASYRDQGRAKVDGEPHGVARLFAEPREGRLTGAVLVAPGAEHMGHLFAWAIARGMTASEMLDMPFYHPTLEEGLKPALRAICRAVPASGAFDKSDPPGA